MPKPTKPTVPPAALRSNPETFSANAEGTIAFFPTLTDYMDAGMDFASEEADRATAAAVLATGGGGLDLTGQAGKFIRVNGGETGTEFVEGLVLSPGSDGSELDLSAAGRALLEAADVGVQQALLGVVDLTGAVVAFAMGAAPTGWLKANGAAVSRTAYAALFAKIGTTHGAGDGSTTFNVPEARGEFIRGWDDARGVDASRVLGSYQADAFKQHNHGDVPLKTAASDRPLPDAQTSSIFSLNNAGSTSSAGGTETRPRNIALLYCIKY